MGMGILGCGVTLSLPCLIFWCFPFLSVLVRSWFKWRCRDSFSFHLGHGVVVFLCSSLSASVSESLWVCVHKCITHIECKKRLWSILLLFSPFLFSHACSFCYWAINIVEQPFAWHSQMLTVSEPCAGAVYAIQYTVFKPFMFCSKTCS